MADNKDAAFFGLMQDLSNDAGLAGVSISDEDIPAVKKSIEDLLSKYSLSTDQSVVNQVARVMKLNDEEIDFNSVPKELKDAAFMPMGASAQVSLHYDIELLMSFMPEWDTQLQLTTDMICESDVSTGALARNITFKNRELDEEEYSHVMSQIENMEKTYELTNKIKRAVRNTLEQGEAYLYCTPYSRIFNDILNYTRDGNSSGTIGWEDMSSMYTPGGGDFAFNESSKFSNFEFDESNQVSLYDMMQPAYKNHKTSDNFSFVNEFCTDAELIKDGIMLESTAVLDAKNDKNVNGMTKEELDGYMEYISKNIKCIKSPVSVPVVEHPIEGIINAYRIKYNLDNQSTQQPQTPFRMMMEAESQKDDLIGDTSKRLSHIKGIYTRELKSTHCIPIRIDETIIGYYYQSDFVRPEENGLRHNLGRATYSAGSTTGRFDTFSPDRLLCERLAAKIIDNFDMKFVRNNAAVHKEIASIVQAHKFNQSMLKFIFIPARDVIPVMCQKDTHGVGHSMFESVLPSARLYLFLKLYSILYQINNSQIRVYNINTSKMTKNLKTLVDNAMDKVTRRRTTVNDLFMFNGSVSKIDGGSEMIMPLGPDGKAPMEISTIEPAQPPVNTDLLEASKDDALMTAVPTAMVNQARSELDFAKEIELSNTRMNSWISGLKMEFNAPFTQFYRMMARHTTDIAPELIDSMEFSFKVIMSKRAEVDTNQLQYATTICEYFEPLLLEASDIGGDGKMTNMQKQFRLEMTRRYCPSINTDEVIELYNIARDKAVKKDIEKDANNDNPVSAQNAGEENGGIMM